MRNPSEGIHQCCGILVAESCTVAELDFIPESPVMTHFYKALPILPPDLTRKMSGWGRVFLSPGVPALGLHSVCTETRAVQQHRPRGRPKTSPRDGQVGDPHRIEENGNHRNVLKGPGVKHPNLTGGRHGVTGYRRGAGAPCHPRRQAVALCGAWGVSQFHIHRIRQKGSHSLHHLKRTIGPQCLARNEKGVVKGPPAPKTSSREE